ncbi:condensation domain-containing protein [Vibrio sp. PP-XX7]
MSYYRATSYELESVYIAALGHSLRALTGQETYLLTMESHGRNSLPSDKAKINISRTVGWFTCFYPSLLAVQASEAETLQRVESEKTQLTEPGLSYMLSRWMTDAGKSYQFTRKSVSTIWVIFLISRLPAVTYYDWISMFRAQLIIQTWNVNTSWIG